MISALWFLLVGSLLLTTGLFSSAIKRLPVTSAIIYLLVGLIFGPTVFNAYHFNPLKESALLEVLTEIAVLISLFAAGVKMPMPFRLQRWKTPIVLATLSMTLTVAFVAAFCVYVLRMPLGAAILLGAIVAPTDPVLATDIQIQNHEDHNRLRFNLTAEAGMNDGSAFPFVMLGLGLLGLHELGDMGMRWLLVDVLWATLAGVLIGLAMGRLVARLVWKLRQKNATQTFWHDFLGLGLIAVVYGLSELIEAWGFLAVFFAAVSLRHTEHKLAAEPETKTLQESMPSDAGSGDVEAQVPEPVSEGSLVFKEHLERLSELLLVLLVGGSLFLDSWSFRAVGFAAFLFLVARPASVLLGLAFSRGSWRMRGMLGWFGVRGIGSLYYLMYAIEHGLPEDLALEFIHITLVVVALSILLHGISVKPMMASFLRRKK
ncbi:MAG: cation:proton antiporter [Xanthomonadales bacterium]|nr:cation:proton antiporter [Xanthomonadales bacterium]